MAKIEAPNKGYHGTGPGGAVFKDGVAETDDEAAINYYRSAGYAVDGKVDTELTPQEVPDPRDYEDQVIGTRLRDAAVDPEPTDFLAPVNAGEANPHGPEVVSPEIHASGPAGIRPGEVFVEDLGKQEKRESEFAAARLIENVAAGEAVLVEVPNLDERGPLDLSDPGSAEAGQAAAAEGGDTSDAADPADEATAAPAKSDNKAAWVDYAVAQGADRDEADGKTKAELIEQYGA